MIRRKNGISYRKNAQSGIALAMALIVLFVLSVLGAGVMFSTQTEMWNSANLRGTTQARYVAEAGVSQALTWLNNSSVFGWSNISTFLFSTSCTYSTVPATCTSGSNQVQLVMAPSGFPGGASDTWASFNSQSPTFGTQDSSFLALSTNSGTTLATANSNLPANSSFKVSAQLLQLNQVTTGVVRAKWKLISVGTVPGMTGSSSNVQVEEVVENTQYVNGSGGGQMFNYALYTTGTGCNTVSLNGGGTTGSYNSITTGAGNVPVNNYTQGDIASNGNVSISNGYYIGGRLFSSLTGVDSAMNYYWWNSAAQQEQQTFWGTAGGYSYSSSDYGASGMGCNSTHLYALNEDNSGNVVTGGLGTTVNQYVGCFTATSTCPSGWNTYIPQTFPATPNATITASANNVTCSASTGGDGGCGGNYNWNATNTGTWNASGGVGSTHEQILTGSIYAFSLAPSTTVNYGNVNLGTATVQMHLTPGTYNFNSLTLSGSANVVLDLPSSCATSPTQTAGCQVTINIVGDQSAGNSAVTLSGGAITNNDGRPGNLLIQYNGAGNISIDAGASIFATIYAPNAAFSMSGGVGLYGGVVAKTATISNPNGSHPMITFDTSLLTDGPPLPGSSTPAVTSFHIDEFTWSAF